MAVTNEDKKISQLSHLDNPEGKEMIPIAKSGVNYYITPNDILEMMKKGIEALPDNATVETLKALSSGVYLSTSSIALTYAANASASTEKVDMTKSPSIFSGEILWIDNSDASNSIFLRYKTGESYTVSKSSNLVTGIDKNVLYNIKEEEWCFDMSMIMSDNNTFRTVLNGSISDMEKAVKRNVIVGNMGDELYPFSLAKNGDAYNISFNDFSLSDDGLSIRSNSVTINSDLSIVSDTKIIPFVLSGDGSKYLSDNGEYKTVTVPTKVSELQNDSGYAVDSVMRTELANKQSKETGKGLSTNDFTDLLKTKLEGLSNYNDAEVKAALSSLQTTINTLVNENPNDVIDSFNEIKKFLEGVTDKDNLASMLLSLENSITAKIPTKLSQLTNDSNYVQDANYHHTDNNFTTEHLKIVDQMKGLLPNVYGVEMVRGQQDPVYQTWIGKEEFKTSHPILNAFRMAKVKDGEVIGFFDQTNIFKMADGTASNVIIDGTVVTDDGSDVMLVNTDPFWIINGGTDATYERRLVGDAPFTYGGDAAVMVKPFGMCIGYTIVKDNKQRSIRDNTIAGTTSGGQLGVNIMTTNGWPTTNVSRFNYEVYARNKNTDTSKNVPYANAFTFDLEVWCTLLFIKFRTKDLHAQSVCGKGISSNDSAPDASSWGTMTGLRFKKNDGNYVYYKLNSQGFKSSSSGTAYNFDQVINNYRPKMKMFEPQLAMSYAKENNVAQNTNFTYDGYTYKYFNFAGHNGLNEGEMTGVLVKFFSVNVTGYSIPDAADVTNREVEVCFAQPLIRGRLVGWGDVWTWHSGIDCVMHDSTSIDIYQTDNVENLTIDAVSSDKNPGESYGLEKLYDYVGSRTRTEGYQTKNFVDSLMGEVNGSSLHTGECHYNWYTGSAGGGKIGRRGVFFGGRSDNDACSLRFGDALNAPTDTNTYIGGGFRVSLTQA